MKKFAVIFFLILLSVQLAADEVWPACYDKQCKSSDDCCAGAFNFSENRQKDKKYKRKH